jgi:2-C-methyl-D-erythritol 4-phosphate cytidylyltransferase
MRGIIIVAGGKGMRMGADIPKQFIPVGGKPILMRTLEKFYAFDSNMQIVLVLPVFMQDYWASLCDEYDFAVPYVLADGGETRFHSVFNGLQKIGAECTVIGVHDGVRPFVSIKVIEDCYSMAAERGTAVPVIGVVETVRRVEQKDGAVLSVTVPRDDYKLVQTPQVFDSSLLRKAYSQPYKDFFTDDASVVEAYGEEINLVEGNKENIKITTPFDLRLAEILCEE